MAGFNFNPAGVTANPPSWDNSIKWNSPAGGGGFGGGVSPGSSFEPSPGFPSTGDAGFWKNQPTDENYYRTGKFDPKNFLDGYMKKQSNNQNKYQEQAQQGGFQTGEQDGSLGGFSTKIGNDATLVHPPSPFKPFSVAGTPGKSGAGGALGTLAGIGASFIPGLGPGIAAALPGAFGAIGGAIG
jgi:hypothetical protein